MSWGSGEPPLMDEETGESQPMLAESEISGRSSRCCLNLTQHCAVGAREHDPPPSPRHVSKPPHRSTSTPQVKRQTSARPAATKDMTSGDNGRPTMVIPMHGVEKTHRPHSHRDPMSKVQSPTSVFGQRDIGARPEMK